MLVYFVLTYSLLRREKKDNKIHILKHMKYTNDLKPEHAVPVSEN